MCSRCHGADGTGRGSGAFPSLAGQRAAYVYTSLVAFREGRRFSAIMGEIAAKLNDSAMRQIAAYYESLPPRTAPAAPDESAVMRGKATATTGVPQRDIPACVECHGPTAFPKNPVYPKLTSQHASYLSSQLTLLQQRQRGGTSNVNLMHAFVNRLRPQEIHDVIAYYSALSTAADVSFVR
jgi:cytochrome c553